VRTIKLNGQTLIIYTIFSLLFVACIFAAIHALTPVDTNQYKVVTVHSGDTLWGIAKGYKDEVSVTSFVNWVEDVNHIQSDKIEAGDKLYIPIKKEVNSDKSHYELASK
jgi:nucleoid-associated protein YgaU